MVSGSFLPCVWLLPGPVRTCQLVCGSVYTCVLSCFCSHVLDVFMSKHMCTNVPLYVKTCLCARVHVYESACPCVHACVLFVYVQACVFVHVGVCTCVHMDAGVGVCLCVCAHLCGGAGAQFISAPRMRSQCPPSAPAFGVSARAWLGKC